MSEFKIEDSDFVTLKGKVVVITGGSSGIGLATTELLLSSGSLVVVGDQNEPPVTNPNLTFLKTDVTSWADLLALFKLAHSKHNRIDHVFANAGIGNKADYFTSNYDEAGELLEPTRATYEVNLRGMINTSYLGLHYFRTQDPHPTDSAAKCSIVCTGSASSFQRFTPVDYTTAKHGVLGFMRSIVANLKEQPVRINAIAPSWTLTGLLPPHFADAAAKSGFEMQGPEAVARSVAVLFADDARQGELIYSVGGRFYEIEDTILLPAAHKAVGKPENGVWNDLKHAREKGK